MVLNYYENLKKVIVPKEHKFIMYNIISMIIAILSLVASVWGLIIATKVKEAVEDTKKVMYIRNRREDLLLQLNVISKECTSDNASALLLIMEQIKNEVKFSQVEKDLIAESHFNLKRCYHDIISNYSINKARNEQIYTEAYGAVLSVLSAIQE